MSIEGSIDDPKTVGNGSRSFSIELSIADARLMEVTNSLNPVGSNSGRKSME